MQFPITVKHNTQNSYVTLRGYGIQPRVLNPFSEPTTMDVKLIIPTDYPIIVLSSQFDLQLLVDQAIEDDSAIQFTNAKTSSQFHLLIELKE